MLDIFLRQATEMLGKIEHEINTGEFIQARHETHNLKGSAKTLYAEQLTNACQALENTLLASDKDTLSDKLAAVQSACKNLTQAVAEKLNDLGNQ